VSGSSAYGMMEKPPGWLMKPLGFNVSAWVRSPREAAGIPFLMDPIPARSNFSPARNRCLACCRYQRKQKHILRRPLCHEAEGDAS